MQHLFFQKGIRLLFWRFPMTALLVWWGICLLPVSRLNLPWKGQKYEKKASLEWSREWLSQLDSAALTFSWSSFYCLSQSALGFLPVTFKFILATILENSIVTVKCCQQLLSCQNKKNSPTAIRTTQTQTHPLFARSLHTALRVLRSLRNACS